MACHYGFIGGGNMAAALLGGMLKKGLCRQDQALVSDVSAERRDYIAREFGVLATDSNAELVSQCECLILAIKPQIFNQVSPEISPLITPEKTLISILAGVNTANLRKGLGGMTRLVRVMPNLPANIGKGVTGIALSPQTPSDCYQIAEDICAAVGTTLRLEEELMDALTSISGNGPGYLFRFAQHLVNAGVSVGLSEEQALLLVRHTFLGGAELLFNSTDSPAELCRRVCSPGGSTQAGLAAMENEGLENAILKGIVAARDRARELSGG